MLTVGFSPAQFDPCVYTYGRGDTFVILTLCMDDILVTGQDEKVVEQLKKSLTDWFAMTDMGEVSHLLGEKVTRDYKQGTISISQVNYVNSIVETFGMKDCNPVHTPGYGCELSNQQPEESLCWMQPGRSYTKRSWIDALPRQVHMLEHVIRCKPAYTSMQQACKTPCDCVEERTKVPQGTPGPAHHLQARTVLNTRIHRSQLCTQPRLSQIDDRTNIFPVRRTCKFSSEDAVANCTIQSGGRANGHHLQYKGGGVPVYCYVRIAHKENFRNALINSDNTGALTVATNWTHSSRTKHIALRVFVIRGLINEGKIAFKFALTGRMLADIASTSISAKLSSRAPCSISRIFLDEFP